MEKPVMISISGIRGVVGEGLSPELLVNYSAAAGTFFGKGRVMVGRDSRVTGEMVKASVFSGLMSVGCDPVDLGICPTPTLQHTVQELECVGGIVISASHNPGQWNGLKLIGPDGLFLDQDQGDVIKNIVHKKSFRYEKWNRVGRPLSYSHSIEDHIRSILNVKYIDIEKIREKKFRVAIDCVNGAGGTILPRLLKELGCEVFAINEKPSGLFAHNPEPLPENLSQLSTLVRKTDADVGFCVDPDVDRCAIVTEKGEPIGEEYTVTIAIKHILSKKRGPVVVNVSTTRAVDDVASESGCRVMRTPVGEINVAKKIKEAGAVIGGEGNGGVILPDVHLGRDAPVAISLVLQQLAESELSMSSLYKSLPQYYITKKKIEIGSSRPEQIIEKLGNHISDAAITRIDGIKIEWADSWVHIRRSNTEPIIRIIAEAKTKKESEELADSFLNRIKSIAKPTAN